MTTGLEAIEARVDKCALKWGDDDVEVVNQRLLLAVARAVAEEHAAMDAYVAAHSNPLLTDADIDAFGEAADRVVAARHKLQAAIAPLFEEVRG